MSVAAYFAILGVANGVWLARIPAVKERLHLTDGVLGLALLAAPAALIVIVPIAGRVVRLSGSRIPVMISGTCASILPVIMGLAPNVPTLMAGLSACGLAGGMLDVGANAQAVQVERGVGRPLMTSFHACFSFGGLAGSLLGGLFAWASLGPAVNFAAVGVPLMVVAIAAGGGLLHDEPAPAARQPDGHAGSGDTSGRAPRMSALLLILGLLALCALLAEGAADGWSAVYMRDNVGTSAGFAALGFAGFSVAMACGRLAGDRLALRMGQARLMRYCGLLAAAGLLIALLTRNPAGAVVGFTLFGAGLSCTFPLLLSAAGNVNPLHAAHGIARVAGLGYVGMLGGPVLIGGLASRFGLTAALVVPVVLALFLAAGAGAVSVRKQAQRRHASVSSGQTRNLRRDPSP